ncbi:zinc-binding dehydrogenase, partial [bacterium]|nr:zinc-binding dehydrogenase [bacterium]
RRAWARNGRLVTCGATTGHRVGVNLRHLFIKNQAILGSTMGSAEDLREVVGKVFSGAYRPLVDRVYPLAEAARAHARLESGQAVGKVLLDLS